MRAIGFTGTARGMSAAQKEALMTLLGDETGFTFHHGDCIGADAEAHDIALAAGAAVHIHPPTDRKARAFCTNGVLHPPAPYLVRNHHIVDVCEVLIAAPRGAEVLRSGTWATIRYARKIGRRIVIL